MNSLVGYAVTTGEVFIQSDGSPWRPLVHVEDIGGAFLAVLNAPASSYITKRSMSAVPTELSDSGSR